MATTVPPIAGGAAVPSTWLTLVASLLTAHDAFLSTPLAAMVHTTVITSIPNTTPVAAMFNTVDYDSGSMANLAVNNDRLTLTQTGFYVIAGYIGWPANATGTRGALLYVNGVENGAQRGPASPTSLNGTTQTVLFPYRCTVVGDYVQLFRYQTSGAALNDGSAGFTPRLAVFRVAN